MDAFRDQNELFKLDIPHFLMLRSFVSLHMLLKIQSVLFKASVGVLMMPDRPEHLTKNETHMLPSSEQHLMEQKQLTSLQMKSPAHIL